MPMLQVRICEFAVIGKREGYAYQPYVGDARGRVLVAVLASEMILAKFDSEKQVGE